MPRAVSVVLDVARGIRYAHECNVIHGDIKPSNILLKDGKAKLSDWGLSTLKAKGESTTIVGATLEYAAPEELSPEFGRVDERTDIWQLGVVFYQLLTGRMPFEGTIAERQYAIMHTDPLPPSRMVPAAYDLDLIITRCLQKSKDDRYRTTDELISALEAYKPLQICGRCGTQVPLGVRFCRQCGATVMKAA